MPLAAHRPSFFQFFIQNWPKRRTIKVWSGEKVNVAIIRSVLLTHSGFNDKTINKIVILSLSKDHCPKQCSALLGYKQEPKRIRTCCP
jgi:hypothetical protein